MGFPTCQRRSRAWRFDIRKTGSLWLCQRAVKTGQWRAVKRAVKASHFEGSIALSAEGTAHGRDESTQCEPATYYIDPGGQWLVPTSQPRNHDWLLGGIRSHYVTQEGLGPIIPWAEATRLPSYSRYATSKKAGSLAQITPEKGGLVLLRAGK